MKLFLKIEIKLKIYMTVEVVFQRDGVIVFVDVQYLMFFFGILLLFFIKLFFVNKRLL